MAVVFTLLKAQPHRLVYNVTIGGAENADRAKAAVLADCVPGPLKTELTALANWGYPAFYNTGKLKVSIIPTAAVAVSAQPHTAADAINVAGAAAADTILTIEYVHSTIL